MYPQEITTTPTWIRHNLPVCPPPPPNGDENLRQQIKLRNVKASDEMIEEYVRVERSRLDLKWCLDQYFGWNVPDPSLGQIVTVNIFGSTHLAYIIDINIVNITVMPVDMLGDSAVVGFDDIYTAENGPFYKQFLLNHHILHSQHVLDYIAYQKSQEQLMLFKHKVSCDMIVVESVCQYPEPEWPVGEETWLFHDELPQRNQFIQCRQQFVPHPSTFNIVEHRVRQTSSKSDCVASSKTQQSNEIILLLQEVLAKQDILLEQSKQLKQEVAAQDIAINNLSLAVKALQGSIILCENVSSIQQFSSATTAPSLQSTPPLIRNVEPCLKEQDVKAVQVQQINQLMNYNLSSKIYFQDGLNNIDDRNTEYGHINVKTSWLQYTLITTNLTMFIFISMVFGIFYSYLITHGGINTSDFSNYRLVHGVNDMDWFRTLAVP